MGWAPGGRGGGYCMYVGKATGGKKREKKEKRDGKSRQEEEIYLSKLDG